MINSIFSLKNKVAVVTGSLGLLGKQHCFALSEAGANLVVTDIDKDKCKSFAYNFPGDNLGIGADITDPDSLKILRDKVLSHFGRIDILVNNAAINDIFTAEDPSIKNHLTVAEQSKFENYPLEKWKKSIDVNITGMFLCCQILGSEMAKKKKGNIINIASTYGIVAPDQSLYQKEDGTRVFYKSAVYSATKGAVISFTKFLAAYWGNKGVRVNALSPGGVENNQDEFFINKYSEKTPLGRMAAPSDYKGALIFLAGDASEYMTGANLIIDGGFTIW